MLKNEKVNVLSTIVKYHEDTAVFVDLYGKLKTKSLSAVIKELKKFTDTNLIRHFHLEDTIVYPCIREHVPAKIPVIEKYVQEHREILAELHRITGSDEGDLVTATEEVLRKLLGHTIDEDKNINNLIEKHSHLQLIMGRMYLLNQQKLHDDPAGRPAGKS